MSVKSSILCCTVLAKEQNPAEMTALLLIILKEGDFN